MDSTKWTAKTAETSLRRLVILDLIGSRLRSGESREGLLNARAIACGYIGSAKLVELAQEGVGIGENANALDVGFQLRAGNRKDRRRFGEIVEIGAGPAAAEAHRRAPRIHHLGNNGAGRPTHRGSVLVLELLRCFRENERLVGPNEEDDQVWRQRRFGEARVSDILRLILEYGNLRYIFRPHVAEVGEDLQRVHQVLLLRRRRLQVVRVHADGTQFMVARGGGER